VPAQPRVLPVVAIQKGNRAGINRAGFREGRRHFRPLDKQLERRAIGIFGADEVNRLEAKVAIPRAPMREKNSPPNRSKARNRARRAVLRSLPAPGEPIVLSPRACIAPGLSRRRLF
jgi:hypothetical protein